METESPVAAVILAAGRASRFGAAKMAARIGARTMLGVVADTATAAGLAPVLAVVPSIMPVPETVAAVRNDDAGAGLSRSLRLGLAAVSPDAGAAVILLGDQPTVAVDLLRRLAGARGTRPIVATRFENRLGPPVLLEREAFPLADEATGDVGLRDLLDSDPQRVVPVEWNAPLPDVDTPADLDAITEPCPGCGARYLPQSVDETHPYIGASPACWAAYGELLAREFGDVTYGVVHRQSADVYAAQHPGTDGRRQRQSVALHLIAMCRWLEHGDTVERLNRDTQRLASEARDWPWLEPPAGYPMTVVEVLDARDGPTHVTLVRRWAEATWQAWSAHHETVRAWASETFA